jgi:putative peptide zinc metalloprotease protein
MSDQKTFSENWHRIADQRIALRPHVHARRQMFRGEKWYVLEDPFNNQFFRLRPAAYEFVARLRPEKTVSEVWQQCVESNPDEAPGQEDVVQLLAQLYHANLLHYSLPPDSAALFERYKKRRQRETRSKLLSIMFARFPLIDPDRFLKATLPFVGKLISPFGAILWLAVVGWAVKIAVERFDELSAQSQSILAPSNLLLLYAGLAILKTLHEFGHAYFCRKFGGEVHIMGLMLLVFTPLPYVDATSAWQLRSRWQRILIGGAGMIVELFVAALAMFVWASTGPGVIHSLAYNMIFVASVSTLIFNINPLLRYDGYYMLSDLLDIPNLHKRCTDQLKHLVERYTFGRKKSESPARSNGEATFFALFGLASGVYRIIVFGGIILFVADQFLIIGMVIAAVSLIAWVCVPVGKFVNYLASSPRLDRIRARAVVVTLGALAVVLGFLQFIPFPNSFRAPGVLEAQEHSVVVADTPGRLVAIETPSGATVQRGQPLLRLVNEELDLELESTRAQLSQAQSVLLHALTTEIANVAPMQSRIESIEKRLQVLQAMRDALVVRARQDGVWISPESPNLVGATIPRGTQLGHVINPTGFRFVAIVSQDEASHLFSNTVRASQVRLHGEAGEALGVTRQTIIPAEQQYLPSAALGWRGGGEIALDPTDNRGLKTAEPFFQVVASIEPDAPARLLHGRSGKIRFSLPPEPLLKQWTRKLQQLLQRRFQF